MVTTAWQCIINYNYIIIDYIMFKRKSFVQVLSAVHKPEYIRIFTDYILHDYCTMRIILHGIDTELIEINKLGVSCSLIVIPSFLLMAMKTKITFMIPGTGI